MASLSVRKLDEETYKRLRIQAARHQVSMEAEVRRILSEAVAPKRQLGDLFVEQFGPDSGIDLELPKREPHEPIGLDE